MAVSNQMLHDGHEDTALEVERGTTLIEMLVSIALASVIGGLVLTTVILALQISSRLTEQAQDRYTVGLVFEDMSLSLAAATTTVDATDNAPRLVSAKSDRISFFTHAGQGLTQSPRQINYYVKKGTGNKFYELYVEDAAQGVDRLLLSGLNNKDIFTFYTWSTLIKQYFHTSSSKCFEPIPMTGGSIVDPVLRNQILGVKISIEYLGSGNTISQESKSYTHYIPVIENTKVLNINNDVATDIPVQCWEELESFGG